MPTKEAIDETPAGGATRAEGQHDHSIVRAFHAGAQVGDTALDDALGLSKAPRTDTPIPGESTVDHPTPYPICRGLFQALDLQPDDVFVDLGCGWGRVLLYGAICTPATFVGIELVQERARFAQRQADLLVPGRVHIHATNVLDHSYEDATVIYAYRPFAPKVEHAVVKRLHALATQRATRGTPPLRIATHRFLPARFDEGTFVCLQRGALDIYRARCAPR